MKYCNNCGTQLEDSATFCTNCGQAQQVSNDGYTTQSQPKPAGADAPSVGFNILSFLWPLVGLILYLVWKDQYPLKAKSCGKWALISVIIGVVSGVCLGVVIVIIGLGAGM